MQIPVNIRRYQEAIEAIASHPVQTGKVMLYGSSFFAHWGYERAKEQLANATGGKLEILNHGFGGATLDELLYFYPKLVTPYAPAAIVIRSGYNDIAKGLSVEEAVFLLQRLVGWLRSDYPEAPVFLLGVFDARIMDETTHEVFSRYNEAMAQFAAETENVSILDINDFFYECPQDRGNLCKIRDVFVADGLHLTDSAYEEMAQYLGDRVLNCLNK